MNSYDILNEVLLREKTFFIAPEIKKILNNTPLVTKKEAVAMVKPGDILLAHKPKKYLKGVVNQTAEAIISTFQQSPYSSSKYIISPSEVIGYGIPDSEGKTMGSMAEYNFPNYIRMCQHGCIIRVDHMTKQKAAIITKYIRAKAKNKYDFIGLEKALWNRIMREKILTFKIQDEQPIDEVTHPLVCSSIIALGLKKAGVIPEFARSVLNVWPKDFLTTKGCTPICRFEYK
jgi:hypothetical protein